MGNLQSEDMARLTRAGAVDIDTALSWHLTSNHYPPVHPVFLPIAKEAIARANAGDWDSVLDLPNGKRLTVATIVEELHLDFFLEDDDDEPDEDTVDEQRTRCSRCGGWYDSAEGVCPDCEGADGDTLAPGDTIPF